MPAGGDGGGDEADGGTGGIVGGMALACFRSAGQSDASRRGGRARRKGESPSRLASGWGTHEHAQGQ